MCGFVGIFGFKNLDEKILIKMGSSLYSRGPDDSGIYIDHPSQIAFAHQRLSILDLSNAGHQPMTSSSGRYIIVFNGEIYNHLELRKFLKLNVPNQNQPWKGYSDTETLVEFIDKLGIEKALEKIDGMFSFALWDKKNKNLTLAKDRLGEKPLYYGFNEGIFFFGSELKSFKFHPKFNPKIDRNSLALFIKYNFIPTPSSIYQGIYKLPPGSFLTISNKQQELQPKKYWDIYNTINNADEKKSKVSESEYVEELDSLLNKTVSKQMLSDVPIGAFLSGGIDSSTIVALMQANSLKKIKTFTIGFDEFDYNEAKYAKKISKILGTDHNETLLSSNCHA